MESEGPIERRRFLVRGRVQGVGFRWFTTRLADRLGLAGWVKNDPGGTVSGEVEGSPDRLEAFAHGLHQGPPGGRVDAVEVEPIAAAAACGSGFLVRR